MQHEVGSDEDGYPNLPLNPKHEQAHSDFNVGPYLNLDAWWNEFDAENDDMVPERRSASTRKGGRSQSASQLECARLAKKKNSKTSDISSTEVRSYLIDWSKHPSHFGILEYAESKEL